MDRLRTSLVLFAVCFLAITSAVFLAFAVGSGLIATLSTETLRDFLAARASGLDWLSSWF